MDLDEFIAELLQRTVIIFYGNGSRRGIIIPLREHTLSSHYFSNIDTENVNSVRIPPAIRIIDEETFNDWYNLREVFLPPTIEIIGDAAFGSCHNLTNINIPSNTSIRPTSFFGCTSIPILMSGNYFAILARSGVSVLGSIARVPIRPPGMTEEEFNSQIIRIMDTTDELQRNVMITTSGTPGVVSFYYIDSNYSHSILYNILQNLSFNGSLTVLLPSSSSSEFTVITGLRTDILNLSYNFSISTNGDVRNLTINWSDFVDSFNRGFEQN